MVVLNCDTNNLGTGNPEERSHELIWLHFPLKGNEGQNVAPDFMTYFYEFYGERALYKVLRSFDGTAWKVYKCGVISGPYFSVLGLQLDQK